MAKKPITEIATPNSSAETPTPGKPSKLLDTRVISGSSYYHFDWHASHYVNPMLEHRHLFTRDNVLFTVSELCHAQQA